MQPNNIIESLRWYACRTYGRHERVVDDRLREEGSFETFLPLVRVTRRWSDRTMRLKLPLFPSYLFVRFDLVDLYRVLGTRGVAEVLSSGKALIPVADAEIGAIRHLVEVWDVHGDPVKPEPLLAKGQRVRICGGPFESVVGIVMECRRKTRVIVGVHAIGLGVSIEVDAGLVEPVDGTGALFRPLRVGSSVDRSEKVQSLEGCSKCVAQR